MDLAQRIHRPITILALVGALLGTAACTSSEKATVDSVPKATADPGAYRVPRNICASIDFSPLAAVIGKTRKAPENTTLAGNDSGGGAECVQSLGPVVVSDEAFVGCWAYIDVSNTVEHFAYLRRNGARYTVDGVKDTPLVGQQAFQYSHKQDSPPWKTELWLTVRDSNLGCELKARTQSPLRDDQTTEVYKALADIARTTLPRLR
ncbi:hypothetical protein ABZ990_23725 [Streptomyces sp. NPDC046203]|uniref:hypothetical protein n=1 Tax=Streptomyces sp. NPDC046203 TaxID=3154602 RepID=UPI0033C4ED77